LPDPVIIIAYANSIGPTHFALPFHISFNSFICSSLIFSPHPVVSNTPVSAQDFAALQKGNQGSLLPQHSAFLLYARALMCALRFLLKLMKLSHFFYPIKRYPHNCPANISEAAPIGLTWHLFHNEKPRRVSQSKLARVFKPKHEIATSGSPGNPELTHQPFVRSESLAQITSPPQIERL
jgi:hypothetical protein